MTLSALGEPSLDAADVEHLLGCQRCSDDVRGLRRTVVAARGPRADVAVEPPPEVWQAVVAELGLVTGTASAAHEAALPPVGPAQQERPARGRAARLLAVAAGAVVLALAAGATGAALAGRDDDRPAPEIAQARLQPFSAGAEAAGTARLVGDPAARLLEVQLSGLDRGDGYYEVWLIDPATTAMVSLGVLPPTTAAATLRVPEGLDVATYSLVDVSQEPLDGVPTHSGTSVARGELARA
jgi:hypothetical protein